MSQTPPTLSPWVVVLVTASSQAEAESLAKALVEAKLAACVNLYPVRSFYRWQGELCCDQEWQLTIKTRLASFGRLAHEVQQRHSYDTPEIIALPIVTGSPSYLDWLDAQTVLPSSGQTSPA